MKKGCPYCRTIIKINKDEVEHIEYNGRGVICPWCGGFIEVPEKPWYYENNSSSRTYGRTIIYRKKRNVKIAILILLIIPIPIMIYLTFNTDIFGYMYIEHKEQEFSTFTIIDNVTSYDLSDKIKVSIYGSNNNLLSKEEDIYSLENFNQLIDSEYAANISIDLRPFSYTWLQIISNDYRWGVRRHIDPNAEFLLLYTGRNYNYWLLSCNISNINWDFFDFTIPLLSRE